VIGYWVIGYWGGFAPGICFSFAVRLGKPRSILGFARPICRYGERVFLPVFPTPQGWHTPPSHLLPMHNG
jgi:hypothetical protein